MAAKVELAGYVRKPEQKTSKAGKSYNSFGLSVKTGKDTEGKPTYSWFNCRDMRSADLPKEKDYIVVKGGLNVSVSQKGEKTYTNLDVFVDAIELPPPKEGAEASKPTIAKPAKEPWED